MSNGSPVLIDRSIAQLESLAAFLTDEVQQPMDDHRPSLLGTAALQGGAAHDLRAPPKAARRPKDSRISGTPPGAKMHRLRGMSARIQGHTVPARIRAFIDCPNCGRISKPEAEMMVIQGSGGPDHVHCHFQCERCGSRKALLHLEREILSRH